MKNKNYTIVGTVPKSNRKIIETKGDGGYIPKDANAWPLNFHGLVQAFNKMWQGYTSLMYPPTPLYVPTHPSLCEMMQSYKCFQHFRINANPLL
jgi:hypothetical protein